MSVNTNDLPPSRRGARVRREAFSTALFTSLNIAVFMVLAASVVAASILYGQGA